MITSYCVFTADCATERILKIGRHFDEVMTNTGSVTYAEGGGGKLGVQAALEDKLFSELKL